jgi:hypothetical protein
VNVIQSAVISDDGVYRYQLTRTWDPESPELAWIMLNPSTADALADDPTVHYEGPGYEHDADYLDLPEVAELRRRVERMNLTHTNDDHCPLCAGSCGGSA